MTGRDVTGRDVAGQSSLGTVRALICEDEPLAVRALREYLADVRWVEVVGDAGEGGEAVRLIHKLEPDLVFMDVQMPGLSGVEVLETVTHRAAVVFTTAHDEHAVRAFELGAVDYLVKPFGRERLLECLGRVRVRLVGEGRGASPGGSGARLDRLFVRRRDSIVPVRTGSIVRVDAEAGGGLVVTGDAAYELDMTLSELEDKLDPSDFVRVHRAHIVNLRHVEEIRRYDERRLLIRLSDGSDLVASRRGSETLRERMR